MADEVIGDSMLARHQAREEELQRRSAPEGNASKDGKKGKSDRKPKSVPRSEPPDSRTKVLRVGDYRLSPIHTIIGATNSEYANGCLYLFNLAEDGDYPGYFTEDIGHFLGRVYRKGKMNGNLEISAERYLVVGIRNRNPDGKKDLVLGTYVGNYDEEASRWGTRAVFGYKTFAAYRTGRISEDMAQRLVETKEGDLERFVKVLDRTLSVFLEVLRKTDIRHTILVQDDIAQHESVQDVLKRQLGVEMPAKDSKSFLYM
tara:strand:- start:55 stop:831 length:777 start_codon:yes stop_codon:yes gene_type:complete